MLSSASLKSRSPSRAAETTMKILLSNLAGDTVATIGASPITINRTATASVAKLSHLVLVVDRSGSMYCDIDALKQTIKKVLTLQEYKDSGLLVTLVSYSSAGDTTTHFSRVPVALIMQTGSLEQREIDKLHATALTCISGGLDLASKQVKSGEQTVIMLHTDGYANDPSSYSETRSIDAVIGRLSSNPDVMVNCVAYSYADFGLLDRIASKCGGVCTQARTAGQVYDAMHRTASTMAGSGEPALRLQGSGTIIGYSRSAGKVIFGENEVMVRGLKASDDLQAWVLNGKVDGDAPLDLALAYARVMLAQGKPDVAKQVVLGARVESLYSHRRALTVPQLADFAVALDDALFNPSATVTIAKRAGVASAGPTVLAVVALLNANIGNFELDRKAFMTSYSRRSEQRLSGVWESGVFKKAAYELEVDPARTWAPVISIEQSQTAATINIKTSQPAMLVSSATGREVREVAGINLDGKLTAVRAMTIVGDGSVTVPEIVIRSSHKRLTSELAKMGFPADKQGVITIPLGTLDVVPTGEVGQELFEDKDIVAKLTACKIAASILTACLKEQSTAYTKDQLSDLKEHCLSGSLNYNPTTTTPWDPKDPNGRSEYIAKGKLDSYTRYVIEVGTTSMLSLGDLHSANEMLDRFYEVTVKGSKVKGPKMHMMWDGWTIARKELSSRAKPVPADAVQRPWFDEFLLKPGKLWSGLLEDAGCDAEQVDQFSEWQSLSDADKVELFTALKKTIGDYADTLFAQVLGPTVLYMGATGFLPECIAKVATLKNAEQMTKDHGLKIGKDGQETSYYVLPDSRVLTITPETAWFSTGK